MILEFLWKHLLQQLEVKDAHQSKKSVGSTRNSFISLFSFKTVEDEKKISRLYENFENLSKTFSTKVDWEIFEKRLISSTKLFKCKEIG